MFSEFKIDMDGVCIKTSIREEKVSAGAWKCWRLVQRRAHVLAYSGCLVYVRYYPFAFLFVRERLRLSWAGTFRDAFGDFETRLKYGEQDHNMEQEHNIIIMFLLQLLQVCCFYIELGYDIHYTQCIYIYTV